MKLAAVQYRPPHGCPEQAREELRALVLRAEDADLVVCPEMATTGYVFQGAEEIGPFAEEARGPTFQMLSECAKTLGAWVVCGFAERGQDALHNSAMTISPSGALVNCYRKVLLYELDETWAEPGADRPVLQTGALGRLTPAICMDLNDDRFGLHLRATQPDVVAFCTNWVDEDVDILSYWRMRLFGWQGWMVAADRWGTERGVRFYGRSAILGPQGRVLGVLPAIGDGVLYAETQTGKTELR